MVFQRKANTSMKTKQFQQKKGRKIPQQIADNADLGDSMDDDDSGEGEEQIQTTSFNKTPKGKMSFKVAGGGSAVKATPAKTPQRNSLVPTKSSTPAAKGKGSVQQEFKGMKGKQTKRPAEDDDDDDDDEEDDDDEDDDDEEEEDSDMQGLDMDDSDAEDDDDMDEDDDNDEDDEEEESDDDSEKEEQRTKKNGKSVNVKLEKQKNAKKTNQLATPKAEAKQEKGSPAKTVVLSKERKERDARNLYIGGLPKDITVEEIKKMSPDIQNVFLPATSKFPVKSKYAFLEFESEAKAEANHKILQTKKIRGQPLNVDYAGEKSERLKELKPEKRYDMKKLHVSSLPLDTTIAQLAQHFLKARFVLLNESPVHRWATIGYASETEAAEDLGKAQDVHIEGQKVIVVNALITRVNKKHNRNVNKSWAQKNRKGERPAKKVKLSTP